MNRKKLFLLLALFAVIGGALYFYSEYNRKVKDLSRVKPDIQMPAMELVAAFEKDETAANSRFLDKVIAVNGVLKGLEKDENGHYTLVIGDREQLSAVRCSMDSTHQQQADALVAGEAVSIKGVCTGFNENELVGSDVILNRGVVHR